jgi:poly(3-hydroxybutyrate) depolymerase
MISMGINNFTSPTATTYSHIGINNWNPYNLPPNIKIESIKINNSVRRYLLINFNHISSDNILLCFPGGSENMFTFLNYTNFDKIGGRVIIFEGQSAGNKYTFQNAFPWMFKTMQNDIYFVDKIVGDIINYDLQHRQISPKLFLTGKSDGGGFTILYANLSLHKNHIKAIGICSAAHFGINDINNIQPYNRQNYINNGVVIPYNIILPPDISIFIMHGTHDQIMPYNGQLYANSLALKLANLPLQNPKKTIWKKIDNSLKNTYTPNIQSYVNKIIKLTKNEVTKNNYYSCQTAAKYNSYVNFITIFNQNHCWSGHSNSGPDSNNIYNMHLDATYLLTLFFKLDIGNYKPTFNIIPPELYAYNGEKLNHRIDHRIDHRLPDRQLPDHRLDHRIDHRIDHRLPDRQLPDHRLDYRLDHRLDHRLPDRQLINHFSNPFDGGPFNVPFNAPFSAPFSEPFSAPFNNNQFGNQFGSPFSAPINNNQFGDPLNF